MSRLQYDAQALAGRLAVLKDLLFTVEQDGRLAQPAVRRELGAALLQAIEAGMPQTEPSAAPESVDALCDRMPPQQARYVRVLAEYAQLFSQGDEVPPLTRLYVALRALSDGVPPVPVAKAATGDAGTAIAATAPSAIPTTPPPHTALSPGVQTQQSLPIDDLSALPLHQGRLVSFTLADSGCTVYAGYADTANTVPDDLRQMALHTQDGRMCMRLSWQEPKDWIVVRAQHPQNGWLPPSHLYIGGDLRVEVGAMVAGGLLPLRSCPYPLCKRLPLALRITGPSGMQLSSIRVTLAGNGQPALGGRECYQVSGRTLAGGRMTLPLPSLPITRSSSIGVSLRLPGCKCIAWRFAPAQSEERA